jgi:protein gp37
MGKRKYASGFGKVVIHDYMLKRPIPWRKPKYIFLNSMSDTFHEEVPSEFIQKMFDMMGRAKQHQFQVLTKRSRRLLKLNSQLDWCDNIWAGVSVERQDYTFRIDHLRATDARIKFLSLEPMLGPLPDLDLHGIDWVIVGGESGSGARPMREKWVTDIRDQCLASGVPFFFKQWGGRNRKKAGRLLQGRAWDEFPVYLPR